MATIKTPTGNTPQNMLKDSSVTALVIGAGPVSVISRFQKSQSVCPFPSLSTLLNLSISLCVLPIISATSASLEIPIMITALFHLGIPVSLSRFCSEPGFPTSLTSLSSAFLGISPRI